MRSGIVGIVGSNGHGKTLAAAASAVVPALKSGMPVCSSVPLRPSNIGCDDSLYVPLESWGQITKLGVQVDPADSITNNQPCLLLLDEVNALMPSRQTLDMPADLQRLLHQFRKPRVKVVWTSVAWARADKQLREATQVAITSEGTWPDKWLRDETGGILRDADKKRLRRDREDWPSYRRFRWTMYDALAFDEFTLDTTRFVEPLGHQNFYRGRRCEAASVYDTGAQVHLLDWVDKGECVNCGGRKSRPVCKCVVPSAKAKAHA